ncbi:hypothetical protein [Vibrio diazotrophicus]|uniref:DUF3265 domain-containing protein n=1 Tax=Vibrio diazotrophicus TaxID=685 RepID=A0ABX4W7Q9_VIBDI|nr:hypothetical protein [Vibrio diazotrophicus]PNH99728.1 hypothetical protein C1O25_15345 [Vibrio diazotrophicus]
MLNLKLGLCVHLLFKSMLFSMGDVGYLLFIIYYLFLGFVSCGGGDYFFAKEVRIIINVKI